MAAVNEIRGPRRRSAPCLASVARLTGSLLLMLLLSKRAFAQGTRPAAAEVNGVGTQQFELGLTGSVAFTDADDKYHGDNSTKVFAGASGTYELKQWLALGAELAVVDAFQNNSSDCHRCMRRALLTLALGELRMPLGTEHARLFGRLATGPAFSVSTNEHYSLLAAVRVSVGLDVRFWHVYARQFAFLGMMTRVDPQPGLGLEVGASF